MRWLLIKLIKGYQIIFSPFLGANCRYTPSCSEYMIEAISVYGALKGGYMGVRRLGRCHPWREGGYDPVPPKKCASVAKNSNKKSD